MHFGKYVISIQSPLKQRSSFKVKVFRVFRKWILQPIFAALQHLMVLPMLGRHLLEQIRGSSGDATSPALQTFPVDSH